MCLLTITQLLNIQRDNDTEPDDRPVGVDWRRGKGTMVSIRHKCVRSRTIHFQSRTCLMTRIWMIDSNDQLFREYPSWGKELFSSGFRLVQKRPLRTIRSMVFFSYPTADIGFHVRTITTREQARADISGILWFHARLAVPYSASTCERHIGSCTAER